MLTKTNSHETDSNGHIVDYFEYIREMIISGSKISGSVESALLTADSYNESFGLTKDTITDQLLGVCLYRPEESVNRPEKLDRLIRIFVNNEIHKVTGLTLKDFMDLNMTEIKILVDICSEVNKKKDRIVKEVLGDT